jgi:hypothetical protein
VVNAEAVASHAGMATPEAITQGVDWGYMDALFAVDEDLYAAELSRAA